MKRVRLKFLLVNFLITLCALGLEWLLINFAQSRGAMHGLFGLFVVLVWAAPILGTLMAFFLTRTFLPALSFVANTLASYVILIPNAIIDADPEYGSSVSLVVGTIIFFLPGALLALLAGFGAVWIRKSREKRRGNNPGSAGGVRTE
jgi:hypothetical protein